MALKLRRKLVPGFAALEDKCVERNNQIDQYEAKDALRVKRIVALQVECEKRLEQLDLVRAENEALHGIAVDFDAQLADAADDLGAGGRVAVALAAAPSAKRMNKRDTAAIIHAAVTDTPYL